MADVVNLSGNADIDGILWGYKWHVTDLTYSFPVNSNEYTTGGYTSVTGFDQLNATQRLAVIGLLEGPSSIESGNSIESFTNLTFTYVQTAFASLRFGNASSVNYTNDSSVATHTGDHVPGNGGTAEANPPESGYNGNAPFSAGYAQGDTWLTAGSYDNPTLGSFQYTAGFMHEIGHNLGLKHGQTTQTKHGTTFPTLPSDHDSQEYSVMTYNQYVGDPSAASNLPEAPTTYMQDDIAALQYLYGANYGASAHNTDTVYEWSQTTGEEFINGVGMGNPHGVKAFSGYPNPASSTPVNNWILMTVWDGGGNDYYNLSNFTSNLTVDLNPGAWTITDPAQLADLGSDPNTPGSAEHFARGNIANALTDPNNPNETASLIENAIGGSGNDTMTGNVVANALTGNGGNDTLNGGGDFDTLVGGTGDDNYYLNDITFFNFGTSVTFLYDNVVEDANAGTDWVHITALDTFNHLYTLTDNVENVQLTGTLDFSLTGNALDNILVGNNARNTLNGAGGRDTADYRSATSGVTVSLASGTATGGGGADTLVSIENVTGSRFADKITGDAAANVLTGGGGADTLAGGAGNDTFYVDRADDVVNEAANGGSDRVLTRVSYSLKAGQSIELLATTAPAGTLAIHLTGNELSQTIDGNAGGNVLDGRGGVDAMHGLGGNDFYFVDNARDAAFEAAGAGTDRVLASVSYSLRASQSIESLTTTDAAGTQAINLTGNELGQIIDGNAGGNILDGRGGVDAMHGLGGNDFYFVDNARDVTYEAAGAGSDRVLASVSYTLRPGQSIELFTTTDNAGTGAINLIGNELAQTITGNAGTNVIDGKGGSDTLTGLGGNDRFVFDTALNAQTNVDHIADFEHGHDKINLDNAVFTHLTTGTLSSAALFVTGHGTETAQSRIVYDSSTGSLSYDSDGAGAATAVAFALLSSHPALSFADFVVT